MATRPDRLTNNQRELLADLAENTFPPEERAGWSTEKIVQALRVMLDTGVLYIDIHDYGDGKMTEYHLLSRLR